MDASKRLDIAQFVKDAIVKIGSSETHDGTINTKKEAQELSIWLNQQTANKTIVDQETITFVQNEIDAGIRRAEKAEKEAQEKLVRNSVKKTVEKAADLVRSGKDPIKAQENIHRLIMLLKNPDLSEPEKEYVRNTIIELGWGDYMEEFLGNNANSEFVPTPEAESGENKTNGEQVPVAPEAQDADKVQKQNPFEGRKEGDSIPEGPTKPPKSEKVKPKPVEPEDSTPSTPQAEKEEPKYQIPEDGRNKGAQLADIVQDQLDASFYTHDGKVREAVSGLDSKSAYTFVSKFVGKGGGVASSLKGHVGVAELSHIMNMLLRQANAMRIDKKDPAYQGVLKCKIELDNIKKDDGKNSDLKKESSCKRYDKAIETLYNRMSEVLKA